MGIEIQETESPFEHKERKGVEKIGKAIMYNMRKEHIDNMAENLESNKPYWMAEGVQDTLIEAQKTLAEKVQNGASLENVDFKEDGLTLGNTGSLFTTAVAGFIEQRLRPRLVAADLIRFVPGQFSLQGTDSIKIPLRSALITADDLPDDASVTYDDGNYEDQTIQITWKYAANSITIPSMQTANVDIMANELFEIGDALARKADSDIIAEFESATPDDESNENYLGVDNDAGFDDYVDAMVGAMDNDAMTTDILTNPTSYGNLLKQSDLVAALGRSFTGSEGGAVIPKLTELLNHPVHVTTQVSDNNTFFIDRERTGYFLEGSGVQSWDGRRTQHLAIEVIGAYPYGVAIVQPKSLYRLEENTAE